MRQYEGKTRLQGIGMCDGIKAKNLRVGDRRVWNFGSSSEVIRIEPSKTGKTLKVTTLWFNKYAKLEDGEWVGEWQEDTRTLKADTIVVIKELNPTETKGEAKEEVKKEVKKVDAFKKIVKEVGTVVDELPSMEYTEAIKVVDEMLDKINEVKDEVKDEKSKDVLYDMENHLKWVYSSLEELIERQNKKEIQVEDEKKDDKVEEVIIKANKTIEKLGSFNNDNEAYNTIKEVLDEVTTAISTVKDDKRRCILKDLEEDLKDICEVFERC